MDFSAIFSAIATQVTTNLPTAAALLGLIVGIPLVWRLFKKMAR